MQDSLSAVLNPVQVQVALSLASGASLSQAARSSGAGRTTIYTWLKENPAFSAAVEQAKAEYVSTLRDRVRQPSAKALDTLDAILDDPSLHASVRLKAALAVLNRPHFPDQGWHLPEKINQPEKEEALENLAQLEFSHRQVLYAKSVLANTTTAANDSPEPASPASGRQTPTVQSDSLHRQTGTQPHTSGQKTQPVRSTPRPGRNEPCPCGSGLKFKRCCLNKPQFAFTAATP